MEGRERAFGSARKTDETGEKKHRAARCTQTRSPKGKGVKIGWIVVIKTERGGERGLKIPRIQKKKFQWEFARVRWLGGTGHKGGGVLEDRNAVNEEAHGGNWKI